MKPKSIWLKSLAILLILLFVLPWAQIPTVVRAVATEATTAESSVQDRESTDEAITSSVSTKSATSVAFRMFSKEMKVV